MLSASMFGMALIITGIFAMFRGNDGFRRTAMVLMVTWVACTGAVVVLNDYAPWHVFLVIDVLAAFLVTRHPSSKPQAVIGAIYLFQIVFHLTFALHLLTLEVGSRADVATYLDLLAFGGWLQVATLFGGAIYGGGNRVASGAWHRPRAGSSNP